jgi:hypothetical protein
MVHTSTLKKSLAAKTLQCTFRKVDHVVRFLRFRCWLDAA